MKYLLKFVKGPEEVLENVNEVQHYKHKIVYIFTNGSKLEVMKRFLLSSQNISDQAEAQSESAQAVFQRFDQFVNRFIGEVEYEVNRPSNYSISVNEISQFKTALANSRSRKLKKVFSLKP